MHGILGKWEWKMGAGMGTCAVYRMDYRIAGFFEGEIFHEFHKSIAIHENFILKCLLQNHLSQKCS